MAISGFPAVAETDTNEKEHRRKLAKSINRTMSGKLNAITTLTLTASTGSTTLTDARLTPQTHISLMPTTANAVAAQSGIYIPASTQLNGSAVFQHANNSQTDRTFTVLMIG